LFLYYLSYLVLGQGPLKKRKLTANYPTSQSSGKLNGSHKGKAKKREVNRDTIPIPLSEGDGDEDVNSSEQDLEILGSASFLDSLDYKGISRYEVWHGTFSTQHKHTRSKKEIERLHRLTRPINQGSTYDNLPSVQSHDEDEDLWNSDIEDDLSENSEAEEVLTNQDTQSYHSDDEMPYETTLRMHRPSWDFKDKSAIKRLPIKLADGRICQTGVRFSAPQDEYSDDNKSEGQQQGEAFRETMRVEDVSTGARFGRAAVADVVGIPSKKERIRSAKEQIAGICQEIVSDPENNVS